MLEKEHIVNDNKMVLDEEIPIEMICPDCGEKLYPIFTEDIKNTNVSNGVVGVCSMHQCTSCNKEYNTIPIPVIMDY